MSCIQYSVNLFCSCIIGFFFYMFFYIISSYCVVDFYCPHLYFLGGGVLLFCPPPQCVQHGVAGTPSHSAG